ncbi:hypothetical protein PRZ48_004559 [Zasmidium cellare]|uniref:RING-type domain-containing protein n=1 Tax=Zasmidium cellare TaxID=395010 RepID=A0ABR0EPW6_ZASCE|nr:hypothetical protein PRZ48_004559 [Zasmidium cellare]
MNNNPNNAQGAHQPGHWYPSLWLAAGLLACLAIIWRPSSNPLLAAADAAGLRCTWLYYSFFLVVNGIICHWSLNLHSNGVPSKRNFLANLRPPAQLDDEELCAFCKDTPTQPLELPCGHIFCEGCLRTMTERFSHCPLCNVQLFHFRNLSSTLREFYVAALVVDLMFASLFAVIHLFDTDRTVLDRAGTLSLELLDLAFSTYNFYKHRNHQPLVNADLFSKLRYTTIIIAGLNRTLRDPAALQVGFSAWRWSGCAPSATEVWLADGAMSYYAKRILERLAQSTILASILDHVEAGLQFVLERLVQLFNRWRP